MSLPAFASMTDFCTRYGGAVPTEDMGRVDTLLSDASTLIREATGKDWEVGARVAVSAATNTTSITCATDPRDTDLWVGATIEIRTRETDVLVATKVVSAMTATSISWLRGNVSVSTAESVYLPVPGIFTIICCEAARRAYDNPAGFEGESIGGYSWRIGYAAGRGSGVYLTTAEMKAVKRAGGVLGVNSATLSNDLPLVSSSTNVSTSTW